MVLVLATACQSHHQAEQDTLEEIDTFYRSETAQCDESGEAVDGGLMPCDWVTIEGGIYLMGSPDGVGEEREHPEHPVTLQTFDIWRTETTRDQYLACVDAGVCELPQGDNFTCTYLHEEQGNHPMNCIDWYQAKQFCLWLGGRLATESEWEYAASNRGESVLYPWGDEWPTCEVAVIDDADGDGVASAKEELGCGRFSTWPVCSKPLGNTAQGLCDMVGNVYSWVEDWYHESYLVDMGGQIRAAPDDGSAWVVPRGDFRLMRGGGIGSPDAYTITYRQFHPPDFSYGGLGVRCVR